MRKQFMLIFIICFCVVMVSACSSKTAVIVKDETAEELYTTVQEVIDTDEFDAEGNDAQVAVHVCGAVKDPGVYYLSEDSLNQDVLALAGGFAEGAAVDYVNLAEKVCEGEKLYFPFEEELDGFLDITNESNIENDDGMVNINTADTNELMTLPGIGENKANAIVTYREENGDFNSIEDIMNITGIKEGIYNNIKDFIVVK